MSPPKEENLEKSIYGRNPVLEAIVSDQNIDRLYLAYKLQGQVINRIRKEAARRKIPVKNIDLNKINEMVHNKSHQGVVAIISDFYYMPLDDFLNGIEKDQKRIIILDRITDPHNFGAISRTAEAAGFDAIIIPLHDSVSVNNTVVKTSAGAIFHIPVIRINSMQHTVQTLKEQGFWIYGTSPQAEQYHYGVDFSGNFAIIIGSEGKGMRGSLTKLCDTIVKIPESGKIGSLNASVSAGILIYETLRKDYT